MKDEKCKRCPCEDLCDAGLPQPSGCPKQVQSGDFFTEFFNDMMRKSNGK